MSHEVFWMNSAHEKRREVLEMLGLVEPIDVTWFFDVATVLQDCGEAGRLPLYRKAWRLIGAKMANDSETRDAFKSVVQLSDNKAGLDGVPVLHPRGQRGLERASGCRGDRARGTPLLHALGAAKASGCTRIGDC
jgi:hypothetical protein